MLGLVLVEVLLAMGYWWGLDFLVCRSDTHFEGRSIAIYHCITIFLIGAVCRARFGHFQSFMLGPEHKTLQEDGGRGSNRRRPSDQVSPYPLLWNT